MTKCQQTPVKERQGIGCDKASVSAKAKEVVKKEIIPAMQKYCQSQCHESDCQGVCERVEGLLD